ncbi:MAG: Aspartyl-tRNA synthetase [uncultured bacterium]|nr:MAG: Aspartyl-tRNA synthetase [uncultured bacterium]
MERTYVIETLKKIGEEVTIMGWVDVKRDHGKLTFIDLRDRTGKIQCVGVGKMSELTPESVVSIKGLVKARPEKLVNPNVPTGSIELEVTDYEILNKCGELPIPLDSSGLEINEESRLKYRYLDLRRERMRNIVALRSKFSHALREGLVTEGFVEVETPILTKSTKEGARDFIVPSRYHEGKFYALPQSPQQYKQLLMTAGVEKYFQFAKCIRDEDLRADRGYEFTQVDLEMSFVEREDVMKTVESIVKSAVKSVGGVLKDEDFPVVEYSDAIAKYGADKFDLRTEEEKQKGILAFAWVINFPFFKQVDKAVKAEVEDSKSGWTFTHNPFSKPIKEHEDWLMKAENIEKILTTQYDLVCNGYEVGGGSIRAHNPEMLKSVFMIMGYSAKETEESVGHMLEAFKLGTPPHGGIALGLDRLVMLLAKESSLKEVIAFPMTSSGKTSVMDAPCEVSDTQLKELHLKVTK